MLETKHLRLIDAILREGTLTRAAPHVHLSQSAASCQLKELEVRLGGQLFRRQGRTLVPGEAARRIQAAAQRVLPELDNLDRDVAALLHQRHAVRIATACTTAYHWLTPLLRGLRRRFSSLQIDLVPEARWDPVAALREGRLDLAVTTHPPRDRRLRSWPLIEEELELLVEAGHPLASRRWIHARDLAAEHLITFDLPAGELGIFKELLYPAGVAPRRVSRVQLTEAILEMVSAGLGVTVMAPWLARPYLDRGLVQSVPIASKGMKRAWRLYAWRDAPPHQIEFAEAVSGHFRGPAARLARPAG